MLLICAVVFSVVTVTRAEDLTFPPRFQFGVASSSYQTEGAWNVSGKGESIWDRYTHQPTSIPENAKGDVACDSYHQWKRDIEMVQELGVNFYKFSISWPRILPKGFTNDINKEGIKHYNDLIDGLLEKGIEPVITLYHWDLPQRLQDLGGWTNPLITNWFAEYARIVFTLYADRVKTWITINEPVVMCDLAYRFGIMAPGITSGVGAFLCDKHVLLAHAKAWRIYDEEFRAKYHGQVSLTNIGMWFQPATESDETLAELAQQYFIGLYSQPIYGKEGGWPPAIEKILAEYSKKLGFPRSQLPALSKTEIELLRGTYDFYSLNFYTSRVIAKANPGQILKPWPIGDAPELNATLGYDPSWELTASSYFAKHPEGFRKQLSWLKKEYGDIPFIITETGTSNHGGLEDKGRIKFFKDYMTQVLLSIHEDRVNVTAFTVWSLMDSFEWNDGFQTKFGLYEVDFSTPERKRTPRASAVYYSSIIKNRSLDVPDDIIIRQAKTASTANNFNYLFLIGGLVVVAIISLVVYQVRKRMTNQRKDVYIGVRTDG